jgi:indole-3-glycerol phosphate synthase
VANILQQIVTDKRREVAEAKRREPQEALAERAAATPPPRNFFTAVTRDPNPLHVIAEIKRASPSAGVIRPDFDPVAIARGYHAHGASAISCLTDEKYFQGSLGYLERIKQAVPLPVLRKDFIVDPYQVYEARAAGADAVLLIAECLGEAELIDLMILSVQLRLTVLVEVHDVENLLKVRPHIGFPHAGYCLLGINNRDLRTMTTDLSHTLRMLEYVEDPRILVSESGIRTHEDVRRLARAGVPAILVGEHLMKQPDPGRALRTLLRGEGST